MTLALPSATRLRTPLAALLAAALAALLCGLFVHANGYVLLVGLVLTVIAGLVGPWLLIRMVSATLAIDPPRAREGQSVKGRLTLRGRLPWPIVGLRLRGGDELAADIGELPGVRGTRVVVFEHRPSRFGPVPNQPLRIACGFPFGLWWATTSVTVEQSALLWPRVGKAGSVPDVGSAGEGSTAARHVGVGLETCGVRDFRQGDRLRLIHWAASAKLDRLMVRETFAEGLPCVRVGLRTGQRDYADGAQFDDAVRRAATLVQGWTLAGAAVELCIDAKRLRCAPNSMPVAALNYLAHLHWLNLRPDAAAPIGVDVMVEQHGVLR